MRGNSSTTEVASVGRFALGQTFITPGAEEAIQSAGQTAIEFLRRHMSVTGERYPRRTHRRTSFR
jgi:hypothetical protein